jgi:hypothetical protein
MMRRLPLRQELRKLGAATNSLLVRTSWSSACAGSDQMTAPPDQATAGWSRSQRPWIRSVPTQDSDRGCSEWAVQQTRCAGGIAHIQACAAWARHGCFGSRGCSGLAMPLPRLQSRRRRGAHDRFGRDGDLPLRASGDHAHAGGCSRRAIAPLREALARRLWWPRAQDRRCTTGRAGVRAIARRESPPDPYGRRAPRAA